MKLVKYINIDVFAEHKIKNLRNSAMQYSSILLYLLNYDVIYQRFLFTDWHKLVIDNINNIMKTVILQ